MAWIDPRFEEHQRKRFTRENAHLYIRHDVERFFLPGCCPEEFKRPYPKSNAQRQREAEAEAVASEIVREAAAREQAAPEQERRAIEWNMAALRLQRAWLQLGMEQQKAYDPNQPRVPAGQPAGGQWASGENSDYWSKIRLAGPPLVPRQRPPNSRDRTAIAKAVAAWVKENGMAAGEFVAKSSWLYQALPYISSYLDAPKSLGELQEDASTPKLGYDRHHIAEQSSAQEDGYPRSRIDAPDNLVRIPRLRH